MEEELLGVDVIWRQLKLIILAIVDPLGQSGVRGS
jgi:hypothetical protein